MKRSVGCLTDRVVLDHPLVDLVELFGVLVLEVDRLHPGNPEPGLPDLPHNLPGKSGPEGVRLDDADRGVVEVGHGLGGLQGGGRGRRRGRGEEEGQLLKRKPKNIAVL